MIKEDPDLMDDFFSRKDIVFEYTSLAIQEFVCPSRTLSESNKLKDEILNPIEEAQCKMLGEAYYATNKSKFNSEEEAINKMKSDALQNKRAKTKLAKQSTMEDFLFAEIVISPCASKHTDKSSVTPSHCTIMCHDDRWTFYVDTTGLKWNTVFVASPSSSPQLYPLSTLVHLFPCSLARSCPFSVSLFACFSFIVNLFIPFTAALSLFSGCSSICRPFLLHGLMLSKPQSNPLSHFDVPSSAMFLRKTADE
jgi:hypothetical protein